MGRRPAAWEDEYAADFMKVRPSNRPKSGGGWAGWVLFVLLLGGAGAFVRYLYLPLLNHETELTKKSQEAADEAKKQVAKLTATEGRLAELTTKQEQLTGQLTQTVAEKEKLEAELKSVQDSLSEKLENEIQSGNVRIVRRGPDLVVDLADQILFESGKDELHDKGQQVLGQVAPTLAGLKDFNIQVGGHTDSSRITAADTQEHFPTNWELSAARATHVVRFLEEKGKVPGARLVAMGFSMYRPAATNNTATGRAKNRRIELVMMRNRTPIAATPVAPAGSAVSAAE